MGSASNQRLKSSTRVIATGVLPRDPKIPGQDHPKVLSYIDVLRGGKTVGASAAIIGAGGIGFDVAEYLVTGGHSTTLDAAAWRAEWGVADPSVARGGIDPAGPKVEPPARKVYLLQRKSGKPRDWAKPPAGYTARPCKQNR
jgi:2,4-dienoyl-CoA reductase (NADPH2)